jgi:predicted enzyme related to lactoylglutathione lyase
MAAPFVWFDLTTIDSGDCVRDFYTRLFGWSIGPGVGDYQGFVTDGEQPWAGILPADAASAGRWIPYVVVDDLDAAAKQADGFIDHCHARLRLEWTRPRRRVAAAVDRAE